MLSSEFKCNQHDEVIFGICTNNDCQKPRQACYKCLKNYHKNHLDDIIDIEQYELWIQEAYQVKEQIQYTINNLPQIIQLLGELKQEMITRLSNNSSFRQIDIIQMNKWKLVEQSISKNLKQINETIQIIKSDCKQYLADSKLPNQLGDLQPDKILSDQLTSEFRFSKTQKYECVVVSEQGLQAEGYYSCLCEPEIPKDAISKITFRILRAGQLQTVFVGVCVKEWVKLSNYYIPSFTMQGHGLYIISDLGFCYSSHEQQKNDAEISFQFVTDDLITIEVDNVNNHITWKKIQTGETFVLQLQAFTDYHFFVYLGGNAAIQIVNQLI